MDNSNSNSTDINNSLLGLIRSKMKESNYSAIVVPHGDAHDNEYLAEADERVAFISGFTGSNALCVITMDEALCWTDGRYFIQCEKELKSNWKMMKMGVDKNSRDYLIDKFKESLENNINVAFDTALFSNEIYNLYKLLNKKNNKINIVKDSNNIIDSLWSDKKPKYKEDRVFIHDIKYTGEDCKSKYSKCIKKLKDMNVDNKEIKNNSKFAVVLSKLDDIAWISNIRGSDIDFNPVFFSYAILYYDLNSNKSCLDLYSYQNKFKSEDIQNHLKANDINLYDYNDFYNKLKNFNNNNNNNYSDYLLIADISSINQNIYDSITCLDKSKYCLLNTNCVENTKCIKNITEIKGFKDCHIRDGAALVRYFAWLENELINKKNTNINEYDAALKSLEFRKEADLFKGESFACISSSGANAAIIHYKPEKNKCSIIKDNEVYLCDSGAQYLDGTTDTTRTLFFNDDIANEKAKNLIKQEKEMYTRVLIGNLAIERSRFKRRWRLSGKSIDSLARHSLWHIGEDYNHGTGHGVGHYLNVHEGPNGIGGYPNNPNFEEGMIMSNEPGYYLNDKFGIRIENIIGVEADDKNKDLFKFVNYTMVPYEINLLDFDLLSNDYIDYINWYHKICYESLAPELNKFKDELALKYLTKKTKPIKKFEI